MMDILSGIGAVVLALFGAYLLLMILVMGFAFAIIGFAWYTILRALNDPDMEWTVQEERENEWKIKGRRKT